MKRTLFLHTKKKKKCNRSVRMQGAVAPMFPFPDDPLPQDDFGEVTNLIQLCGQHYHGDEDDIDTVLPPGHDDLQTNLDMPTLDLANTKVVVECAPACCQNNLQNATSNCCSGFGASAT